MQSLNPHNAKTYDYMRRSDEVADRILSKSKQLLAKSLDKKHSARSREGVTPVRRIRSPPRQPSPGRAPLHQAGEGASLLNPDLYM